jgi:TonB family protein
VSLGAPSWNANIFSPAISTLQVSGPSLSPAEAEAVETVKAFPSGLSWIDVAVLVWLTGAAVVVLRLLVGTFISIVIVRRARPAGPDLKRLIGLLADETETNRSVRLLVSRSVSVPFAAGVFRTAIVLPESAERWTQEYARMVLLHELAHIKRRDIVWAVAGSLVCAIHWFNPLVWIIRKKLLIEAEKTCDDYVLHAGTGQALYAEHLLSVARSAGGLRLIYPLGAGMARKTQLEGRLMSVLSKRVRSIGTGRWLMAAVMILAAAVVIPLACLNVAVNASDSFAQASGDENTKTASDEQLPSVDEFVPVEIYPQMIKEMKPEYPQAAKDSGVAGTVWVQALVDKKGKVRKVKLAKSSGHKELDESALKAAWGNEFSPAMQNDKPVAVWVTYKVGFSLATKDTTAVKDTTE